MTSRPTWDEHWMSHAIVAAQRAACTRSRVGCVVVATDARGLPWMVSEGYNGAPAGERECIDGGCPRGRMTHEELAANTDYSNCVSIHAEVNALLRAGRDAMGATLYTTRKPCSWCAKVVKAAGIARVVYLTDQPTHDGLKEAEEYVP